MFILIITSMCACWWGQAFGQWPCGNLEGENPLPGFPGKCIHKRWLCNGVIDTFSGSDEGNCTPANCRENQFQCPNHHSMCIPKTTLCDGKKNCPDWYDEMNCSPVNCKNAHYRCPNHQSLCTSKTNLCDGYQHCPDWSDEGNCHRVKCRKDQFLCPNHRRICRPSTALCDGARDCPDWSDEENCAPVVCRDDQLLCKNHLSICIQRTNLCDGYRNCPDGSDESNCGPENCTSNFFYCPMGFCRPKSEKCDGINNCKDGSDEENCPPVTCRDDQFRCTNHEYVCKEKTDLCDGYGHCPDWSDEKNCKPGNCTSEQIYCPKGFCRPKIEKCDGLNDCKDGFDEENCPLAECTAIMFRCENGRCVTHQGGDCDGVNHCGDWSDERNCGWKSCKKEAVKCPDGRCIHRRRYKCNGFNDCGDWTDEAGCNRKWGRNRLRCYHGWHYHRGRCFKAIISDKDLTWQDAQRECHRINTTLASVTSPSDEKFLVKILQNKTGPVYIGLQKDFKNSIRTFKSKLSWEDGLSITYENWQKKEPDGGELEHCSVMIGVTGWKDVFCAEYAARMFVCMKYVFMDRYVRSHYPPGLTSNGSNVSHNWLTTCSSGELTSKYKLCDGYTDCRDGSDEENCDGACKDSQYLCGNGECISLNFYCDGINDCSDNSDEKYCDMKACLDDEWTCANGQCIEESKRCDMRSDCYDETDEADCGELCRDFLCSEGKCIPHSWVNDGKVDCDGYLREDETGPVRDEKNYCLYGADEYGKVSFQLPPGERDCGSFLCPDTYYKCRVSYCIPVMFVCDGKRDCPSGEDEIKCNLYVCHKRYRCQGQSFCIDPQHICDGLRHCPMGDDERYCPLPSACPPSCECDGRVIRCDGNFTLLTTIPTDVRKLNLSGVVIQNASLHLRDLHYLTILDLSYCMLTTVEGLLSNNTNMIYLDISHNALQRVSNESFSSLTRLRYLDLSNNIDLMVERGTFLQLSALQYLNLSNTSFGEINYNSFNGLSSLVKLIMVNSSIKKIEGKPFIGMKSLNSLDISHNDIEQFSCCFLKHLESLESLFTYSYKFCCHTMRPENLAPINCMTTLSDAISSCKDLLGTGALKVMLWIIVLFAMFGNIAVLVYRIKYDRASLKRSYGIFVTNLSISDCLMGVYMLIIGGADAMYRNRYVSEDYGWRHGPICKFAGFLSVLSSEASCIFISLITFDRFLAIKYPFREIKFTKRLTIVTAVITWMIAVALAAIPLLPSLSYWKLYSQNGVCLALPLSSDRTSGWEYATAIFIGLNSIAFIFIGVGQLFIFRELKAMPKIRVGKSDDAKVARRLFLVVITDFFCWLPVGIMGIMALHGISINKEVFSWTAVTVLPINSALNPILYTLPSMIATWKRSSMRKEKTWIDDSLTRETHLPNHPSLRRVRRVVGKRTDGMEMLGDLIRSHEVSNDAKCELIHFIAIFIYDLKQRGKSYEAITDKNVFVSRCGKEISAVCLTMKPDEDRHWQVEDIVYLTRMLLENTGKGKRHHKKGRNTRNEVEIRPSVLHLLNTEGLTTSSVRPLT